MHINPHKQCYTIYLHSILLVGIQLGQHSILYVGYLIGSTTTLEAYGKEKDA